VHFEGRAAPAAPLLIDARQHRAVLELEAAGEAVQAPLQALEQQLHPWVAFGILSLFALANAGVRLSLAGSSGPGWLIGVGTVLGLGVGKPLGLVGLSWVLVRTGRAALPAGVRWAQMVGAGLHDVPVHCVVGLW
jgi:NhaA family Na+:H+ antiporter